MEEYVYFVSYSWKGGFGNAHVTHDSPISTYSDVKLMQELLEKKSKAYGAVVISFQLLSHGNK